MVSAGLALILVAQTTSWTTLPSAPADPGTGAAMASLDHRLYVMRGGNTAEFWCYDAAGAGWTTLAAVPVAVGSGGAMAAGIGCLYALAGGHLRKYEPNLDQWSDLGAPLLAP